MISDKTLYKRLFTLAVPLALQNIITFAVGLADNIMVSSLGELAVSGVYLCNQIQVMLQMLVAGFGAAMVVLGAQYWGKGDSKSVKTLVGIAMKIVSIFAIILWGLVFFFPEQVLGLFTGERLVIVEAVKYAQIICFTYIFFCLTNVLVSSLRCVGTVRIGLYLSIVAFVTNVFLNWVLIYGNLGAPAMGIRGAAIATLVSRIVEFIIVVFYVRFADNKLMIRIADIFHSNRTLLKDFFRYGFPVILGDIVWGLNLAVQGAIVGRLGAASIAAVSIANNAFSILSVGVYGTANASAVIIGNAVGEGDIDKIKRYTKKLQLIFLGVGVLTGLLIFAMKDYVLMLYDLNEETLQIARSLLIVLSATVIGTSYQMSTLTGIVRAGGSTSFVLINDSIFVWLVVIPLSCVMAFVVEAPTWVVYLCLKIDQILKCSVAVVKVNRFNWIKKLTKEFKAA